MKKLIKSPMFVPKMTSNEFKDYIKTNGYERIDDDLLQKEKQYYCVNDVYRQFLNLWKVWKKDNK